MRLSLVALFAVTLGLSACSISFTSGGLSEAEEHINRGNALVNLGQSQRAIQDYDEAIRLEPHLALAYMNRGVAYGNLGQFQRAMQDMQDYDEGGPS